MSVPAPLRSETKLVAQVRTEEMVSHTIQITSNPKVFDPNMSHFVDTIQNCALDVGRSLWKANNIRVGDNRLAWERRHTLQLEAMDGFSDLQYLAGIAKRTFHLRSSKYTHWLKLISEAKSLSRSWIDADVRKYNHLK